MTKRKIEMEVDRREKSNENEEEGIHCIICDKLCKNAYGLGNHVTKTHRIPFSEYKRKVLEAAEKECFVIKQTADKARVLPDALDLSEWVIKIFSIYLNFSKGDGNEGKSKNKQITL